MAYVPGYKCDVFISFSRLDNVAFGDSPPWVGNFARDLKRVLRMRLGVRDEEGLKVFSDHTSIEPSADLESALMENAGQSALFVAVTSPAYVNSSWATRELEAFTRGMGSADHILTIEYLPLDADDDYPAALRNHKRMAFWTRDPERGMPVTLKPGSDRYLQTLFDLGEHIRKKLKTMRESGRGEAAASPAPVGSPGTQALQNKPQKAAAPRAGCKILISYRRDDSEDTSGRIYDRLVTHFGATSIVMDIDSIPFGVDFRHYIARELESCDIVLAIVGPSWAGPSDAGRRIDDENDLVRIEIEAALSRDIPLIPVLVRSARMPKSVELPEPLKPFSFRNAATVGSGADFHDHVTRLIRSLDRHMQDRKPG